MVTEAASKSRDPRPIFVLGLQRSGTTWMANLLANHSQIVGVQAEDHFGIHESVFFSHFARAYGELGDDRAFESFCNDFTASDYYQLTGLEAALLRQRRPRSYSEAFRFVMDRFAALQGGAEYWVEKSPHHTLLAEDLVSAYPDARFVCVTRDAVDLTRSRLRLGEAQLGVRTPRWKRIVRGAGTISLYQRFLERFASAGSSALLVRYEVLKANPEAAIRPVLADLGLEFEDSVLEQCYPANTSFASDEERKTAMSWLEVGAAKTMALMLQAVPVSWLRALERRRQAQRGVVWPEWVWRRRDKGTAR